MDASAFWTLGFRPATKHGRSRPATRGCAASAALTPSRATAKATPTRTARRATRARSHDAGRASACWTACGSGKRGTADGRRPTTGRAPTPGDGVGRPSDGWMTDDGPRQASSQRCLETGRSREKQRLQPRTKVPRPAGRGIVGVGSRRGAGVSAGPFPRSALRTGLACLHASGSPQVHAASLVHGVGI
jgi:hypothetical protein